MSLAFFSRKFSFSGLVPNVGEIVSLLMREAVHSARKIAAMSVIAIGTIIFLCGGGLIALFDATQQYDSIGVIQWSATLTAGVILMGVSAAALLTIFMFAWPGVRERRAASRARQRFENQGYQSAHSAKSGPLEAAMASLIMDFVKERERKRGVREAQFKEQQEFGFMRGAPHEYPQNNANRNPVH